MEFSVLEKLSNAFGPSGYEEEVVRAAADALPDFRLESDAMLNLYIRMRGQAEKPFRIQLDAHLDECGGMVQSIEDNGSLRVRLLGGIHISNLPAHTVMIRNRRGEKIRGIIAAKPVHFMTEQEKANPSLSLEKLLVDVGAVSRRESEEVFGIHIGDPFVPDIRFSYDEKRDLCYGKAFDNRVGCFVVTEVMKKLKEEQADLPMEVVAALAAQEEVGERGATVTAQQLRPDLAIVFEGSPSDDFFFGAGQSQCRMREGTQIRIMDQSHISNPAFLEFAESVAEKHHIRFQEAVRRGGGTNAAVLSLTHQAVPVLVLGVPSRYVHAHGNFCSGEDIRATIALAAAVIRDMTEESLRHILRRDILA